MLESVSGDKDTIQTKPKKPRRKPDAPAEPAIAKGKCCVSNERISTHNNLTSVN